MTDSNESLDERLKSLRIDRTGQPASKRGVPKLALLAFSIVVVLIAGGALWFMSGPKPVDVAEAKRDTGGGAAAGETVLTASGYVIAAHRIAVGSKVLGRVAWIGVDKGDIVQQGQVLVRLEDSEFKAQVAQARGSLASAQARLDELRAGSRPQDKQMRRAAVAEAEATLREAELELERVDRLFKAGVAARAELDRAVARRDVARAQLDNARQSSSLTDVGPRAEQIRAAEAEVAQLRAALDFAETQISNTVIAAPSSGTILQRIVEVGEMVSPQAFGDSGTRTAVVSLADLNDLQIELDISQADFAKLKMGQKAEIVPEAYPELRYTGFIQEIAPEANRAKATVQVKVKVDSPNEQLRPEMNARVNFLAADKALDAPPVAPRVLVPTAAIVRRGDADCVFVVKGDRVEMRTIRRGDASGTSVAVLDGLSGGEQVVTTGVESLVDGDRIRINGR